jgi:hypothetical protein
LYPNDASKLVVVAGNLERERNLESLLF